MEKQSVFVGMSGGVDSSVTAALLCEQGYDVTGVFMKNWTQDFPGSPCTWQDDYQDAKRVAVTLGIDLKVYDFQTEYKQKVVDYMLDEYQSGRTPNPDIMCNQEVKFKLFLDTALEDGADLIATGHYAATKNGQLLRAKDDNKDQTYFLYRVTEKALTKTLFPLGEYANKTEVRAEAAKRGLITAGKKDSQGICFVGQVGIKDFLSQYITPSPGLIKDQHDKTIGEHDGAIFYTIGQRHGLNVGGGLPYYVTHKDMQSNTVYVTNDIQDKQLWNDRILLEQTHWINQPPVQGKTYQVRTRHRAELQDCTYTIENGVETLQLKESMRALTPGQSAVMYDGQIVLGGGIVRG